MSQTYHKEYPLPSPLNSEKELHSLFLRLIHFVTTTNIRNFPCMITSLRELFPQNTFDLCDFFLLVDKAPYTPSRYTCSPYDRHLHIMTSVDIKDANVYIGVGANA